MAISALLLFSIISITCICVMFLSKRRRAKRILERDSHDQLLREQRLHGTRYAVDTDDLIEESRQSLSRLVFFANSIENSRFSAEVRSTCDIAGGILQNAMRKKEFVGDIRYFLNYYLPVLIKLVQDYRDLEKMNAAGSQVREAMTSIEGLVATARSAFQKQLDSIIEDKMIDIAAEIKVFRNSLIEDGYISSAEKHTNKESLRH